MKHINANACLLFFASSLILTGCGGGSSSSGESSISGVAATGAPIVGEVCYIDADAKKGCVDTDNSGNYKLTGSFTAPVLLQAKDDVTTTIQYAIATAAGKVNITPISTMTTMFILDQRLSSNALKDDLFIAADGHNTWKNLVQDTPNLANSFIPAAKDVWLKILEGNADTSWDSDKFNPITGTFIADSANSFDVYLDNHSFTFDFTAGTGQVNGSAVSLELSLADWNLEIKTIVNNISFLPTIEIQNIPKPSNKNEFCDAVEAELLAENAGASIIGCSWETNLPANQWMAYLQLPKANAGFISMLLPTGSENDYYYQYK